MPPLRIQYFDPVESPSVDSPGCEMSEQTPQRKTIRLNRGVYEKEGQSFSITICTWNHIILSNRIRELIFQSAIKGDLMKKSDLMAVCVMPDHVHLLLAPIEENLIGLLSNWKSYTTHAVQLQEKSGKLWQRSFYDHGLRRDEDLMKIAEYIVSNPVRTDLVAVWETYPFAWHKWM